MISTKMKTTTILPQKRKDSIDNYNHFRFEKFFQVYSDLHLDVLEERDFREFLTPKTPFLLLAGDISKIDHPSFKEFFLYVSENWQQVFYVLGNHEFYHQTKTYLNLLKEYKSFFSRTTSSRKNVHLLEKESYYICIDDDEKLNTFKIQIVGCTLWSLVPNEKVFTEIGSSTHILKKSSENIDINYYNQRLNRSSVLWLLKEIDNITSNATMPLSVKPDILIVLTHFPTMNSPKIFKPSFRDTGNGSLFLANSNENIDKAIISSLFCSSPQTHVVNSVYFVSGHTHYSFTFRSYGGRVTYISNQRGNTWEEEETRFAR
jgi:hypothetical protein